MDLSAQALAERFEQGEALVLLDVRQPHERDYCRIAAPPGVIDLPIPMGEVPDRIGEIRASSLVNPVVVYCHHGVRSRMVAEWLLSQGVPHVHNLAGGIDVWSRRIDPNVPLY